jgi:hypothetical protein
MPKGWLYDWEDMAALGKAEPGDTFRVESLLVVYLMSTRELITPIAIKIVLYDNTTGIAVRARRVMPGF